VAGITISQGEDNFDNSNGIVIENETATLGKITIPRGVKEVVVKNKIVKDNSYIMLTPNRPIPVGVFEIKAGEYFKIVLDKILNEDLEVNWFILKKGVTSN
jgi:hypothetical protein